MRNLIEKISLTKEEERKINIPIYKSLFEKDSDYLKTIEEEKIRLYEERKKYKSNIEFYQAIGLQFVQSFIPKMIQDYGSKLGQEKIDKLINVMSGNGLKIFSPGEAVNLGYIKTDETGKPLNDDGAFAISELGIIGFTPDSETSKLNLSNKTPDELMQMSAMNALRMEGAMIHETFHLIINIMRNEHFKWSENGEVKSKLTSGGFILNEGLVEKYATEFSRKHSFIHNPALDYFHYVSLCDALEQKVGKDELEQLSFNNDYYEIVSSVFSEEEMNLYRLHERKKYFEKRGIQVETKNIVISMDEPLKSDHKFNM